MRPEGRCLMGKYTDLVSEADESIFVVYKLETLIHQGSFLILILHIRVHSRT